PVAPAAVAPKPPAPPPARTQAPVPPRGPLPSSFIPPPAQPRGWTGREGIWPWILVVCLAVLFLGVGLVFYEVPDDSPWLGGGKRIRAPTNPGQGSTGLASADSASLAGRIARQAREAALSIDEESDPEAALGKSRVLVGIAGALAAA